MSKKHETIRGWQILPIRYRDRSTTDTWDGLIDAGCDPAAADSVEMQIITKAAYEELRERMDTEDPRISQAFEAKELFGDSVKEIAKALQISEPRVYQLIARAKATGKEYKKESCQK